MFGIIKNYLNDRKIKVKINNEFSDEKKMGDGVPQGSNLGPLLFLAYINDIDKCIKHSCYILFADDIMIFYMDKQYKVVTEKMQNDLNNVVQWTIQNELYISENKTKAMIISKSHDKFEGNINKNFRLHSGECLMTDKNETNKECDKKMCPYIKETDFYKYLGVTFDNKFNWKEHIRQLIKKMNSIMTKLYGLRNILSKENKKIIYFAWVESHLRYAINCYAFASDYNIKRLQKVQNKIIKLLFKKNINEKVEDLYIKNEILPIKALRNYILIVKNYYLGNAKKIINYEKNLRERIRNMIIPRWNNF